jgi:hypothetical protein
MADMMAMLQTIVSRLDGLDAKMANLQMGGGGDEGDGGGAELPKSIKAFDEYVRETMDPFVAAGKVLLHQPTHSRHTLTPHTRMRISPLTSTRYYISDWRHLSRRTPTHTSPCSPLPPPALSHLTPPRRRPWALMRRCSPT